MWEAASWDDSDLGWMSSVWVSLFISLLLVFSTLVNIITYLEATFEWSLIWQIKISSSLISYSLLLIPCFFIRGIVFPQNPVTPITHSYPIVLTGQVTS